MEEAKNIASESASSIVQREEEVRVLYQYQGFWFPSKDVVSNVSSFQRNFQALDSDIILASSPKSGTTWIKALAISILNRKDKDKDKDLNSSSPHDIVPCIELELDMLENLPRPRIMGTHIPYQLLPPSLKISNSRIVYVCRNPLDQFISLWQFSLKLRKDREEKDCAQARPPPPSLEERLGRYCRGIHIFGPFADQVLGYWKASLERPDKVLFLKYEDMKADIVSHAKRLADFLGSPFSPQEEEDGVVEEICSFCSFENLKSLEVNQSGRTNAGIQKSIFFRKGKVGDWKQHLSSSQAEFVENLVEEKLNPHGLTLKISTPPAGT